MELQHNTIQIFQRPDAYVTDLAKTGDYKFIKGGMNVPNQM